MKSPYLKFLKNLLIFTLILGLTTIIFRFTLPKHYFSPALPFMFVFFMAASLISFYFLLKSAGKRFIKFVNTFLLTIVAKLFIYAGVMIAYAFSFRFDAIPFMLGFFILYLCYTIFESVSIIQYTRPAEGVHGTEEK